MVIHNGEPAAPLTKTASVLTKGCAAAKEAMRQWKLYMEAHIWPACRKAGGAACSLCGKVGAASARMLGIAAKGAGQGLVLAGRAAGKLCGFVGAAAARDLALVHGAVAGRLSAFGGRVLDRAVRVTDRCGEKIYGFFYGLARPVRSVCHAPRLLADGYRKGGVREAFFTLVEGVYNNLYILRTAVNYTLPVVGIFFLVNVIQSGTQLNYALALEQDGQVIAYVADESVYTTAQRDLKSRIITTDGEAELNLRPTFMMAAVNPEDVTTAAELTDELIQLSTDDIQQAQGLYIDGEFYGAVTSAGLIEDVLDDTLDQYASGAEGEVLEFTRDIQLRDGLYPTDSLADAGELTALLTSEVQSRKTYTIEQGDSPIVIANKNGLTYSEFKALNPGIEEECMVGQETVIAQSEPFLGVRSTKTITYNEEIPFETEVTKDSNKAKGYREVTQEGQKGQKSITARVVTVNGHEESREVLSEIVTAEAVPQKVVEGTKSETTYRAAYSAPTYGSGQYSGTFIWPTSGGYISCYYGSGGHKGLDIANSYGKPVYASMAGKVVVAGWYYSYGKCVVIDHGNGVRTLYGHNSSLNVAVGQTVGQGEVIAQVGSTGYSTGNHVHFEVQINGRTQNPLNYL